MKINIVVQFTSISCVSDVINNLSLKSVTLGGVPINYDVCTIYQHNDEMVCIELSVSGVQPLNQAGFSDLVLGVRQPNIEIDLTYNLIYIEIDGVCVYC